LMLQIENRYDKPLSGTVGKKTENRFYFKVEKLIRWLDENGKEVGAASAEYVPKQTDYLKMAKQFVEGAKSRVATIKSQ